DTTPTALPYPMFPRLPSPCSWPFPGLRCRGGYQKHTLTRSVPLAAQNANELREVGVLDGALESTADLAVRVDQDVRRQLVLAVQAGLLDPGLPLRTVVQPVRRAKAVRRLRAEECFELASIVVHRHEGHLEGHALVERLRLPRLESRDLFFAGDA